MDRECQALLKAGFVALPFVMDPRWIFDEIREVVVRSALISTGTR